MPCCTTAVTVFPASAAKNAPALSTASTVSTSGLIIVAKNDAAHLFLLPSCPIIHWHAPMKPFASATSVRTAAPADAPIGRHHTDRKKMAVTTHNSRNAVTHWEVITRYGGYTHVRCKLETGRTHQIRVHMAHIGHPILGDTVYGAKKPVPGLQGQCLHAVGLQFIHPRTKELVSLSCPLPEEFQKQLRKLEHTC